MTGRNNKHICHKKNNNKKQWPFHLFSGVSFSSYWTQKERRVALFPRLKTKDSLDVPSAPNEANLNPKLFDFTLGKFSVTVIVVKMKSVTQIQFLDEAVCVSFHANVLRKGMNPSVLLQATDKQLDRQIFSLSKATSLGGRKLIESQLYSS